MPPPIELDVGERAGAEALLVHPAGDAVEVDDVGCDGHVGGGHGAAP